MNEEKRIPIKKVRYFVKQTKPLEIRKHRDLSRHEYKQHYLAWNDSNYLVAVYIGKDSKGNEKRDFEELNMRTLLRFIKRATTRPLPTTISYHYTARMAIHWHIN